MNDRELLEHAAKAAEVPLKDLDDRYDCWEETHVHIHRAWNPLTNDGDALRLAVKLEIAITRPFDEAVIRAWYGDEGTESIYEDSLPDPYAATRRAIVHAAAEIGKDMK